MNRMAQLCLAAALPLVFFRRVLALTLAFFAAAAFAQNGQLTGRVSNLATGDLLSGAMVQVEGTNNSTISEQGGVFAVSAPAGPQTLVVTYAGLDTQRVAVNFAAGQTVVRDVQMTSKIYTMDKFSVAGVREGNARAIQVQRQSDNPKWVDPRANV